MVPPLWCEAVVVVVENDWSASVVSPMSFDSPKSVI